jgi:hypothetical protein
MMVVADRCLPFPETSKGLGRERVHVQYIYISVEVANGSMTEI